VGGKKTKPEATIGSSATADAASILEIDLGAVVENWRRLATRVAPGLCAAVVKADAYGLGATKVAPALADAGCRTFFVAQLDEALAVRAVLPEAEIAVLNGLLPGTSRVFVDARLTPVLNDLAQIERWRRKGQGRPAIVHIDTGMNRLGIPVKDVARIGEPGFRLRAVMSHLACAEEATPMNEAQLQLFEAVRAQLPAAPASFANSSGIFLGPAYHYDLARPGVALYGINPTPRQPNPMRPVVRLLARILQLREATAGDTVGYGATYRLERPTRIATIAAGYADGLLRSLSNRGRALAGGTIVPILGRVSMDLITLDVTAADPAAVEPGSLVELLGEAHTVDDLAAEAGTIGYEILTSLGRRYHRVWRS
jgi:alanine racemase